MCNCYKYLANIDTDPKNRSRVVHTHHHQAKYGYSKKGVIRKIVTNVVLLFFVERHNTNMFKAIVRGGWGWGLPDLWRGKFSLKNVKKWENSKTEFGDNHTNTKICEKIFFFKSPALLLKS